MSSKNFIANILFKMRFNIKKYKKHVKEVLSFRAKDTGKFAVYVRRRRLTVVIRELFC